MQPNDYSQDNPPAPQQPEPAYQTTPGPQPYSAQPLAPEAPPQPLPPMPQTYTASPQPEAAAPPANTQSVEASMAQPPEPAPDVNPPTPADEEQVDPSTPAGQREILVIRRHPFGLVALYLESGLGTILALGLLFFLVNSILTNDTRTQVLGYLLLLSIAAIAFVAIFLIIATYIYRQNRWIVTDDCVHQILQRGLFNHQTSELSMANIEDVTAEQKGILAELFGFGTLRAETAGELPYFHFLYCPTPDKYAKIILDARERFINEDPFRAKRANDLLNVPGVRR